MFDDPKWLPCAHVLCARCVSLKSSRCPVCCHAIPDVANLPPAHALQPLILLFKQHEQQQVAEVIPVPPPALSLPSEDEFESSDSPELFPSQQEGATAPGREQGTLPNPNCVQHAGQPYISYCLTCCRSACLECLHEGAHNPPAHRLVKILDAPGALRTLLEEHKHTIEGYVGQVETHLDAVGTLSDNVLGTLSGTARDAVRLADDLCAQLQQWKLSLLCNLQRPLRQAGSSGQPASSGQPIPGGQAGSSGQPIGAQASPSRQAGDSFEKKMGKLVEEIVEHKALCEQTLKRIARVLRWCSFEQMNSLALALKTDAPTLAPNFADALNALEQLVPV